MSTVHNERASFALQSIQRFCEKKKEQVKEYRTIVIKFPALVQTQGLGNALTFLHSKNSASHRSLYMTMMQWMKKQGIIAETSLEHLFNLPTPMYRLATEEVIELAIWMKELAEGMIEIEEDVHSDRNS